MRVIANQKCYSGDMIRQEGEEFEIASEGDLRAWMDPVAAAPKAEKPAKPKAETKTK